MRDQLDYLRALVSECEKLRDLARKLAQQNPTPTTTTTTASSSSPGGNGEVDQVLTRARCIVRIREAAVDWELAVLHHDNNAREGREILDSTGMGAGEGRDAFVTATTGLSREELADLESELKLWEESFPAIREAWDAVGREEG